MSNRSPIVALLEGVAAGLAASAAQHLFFAVTRTIAPRNDGASIPVGEHRGNDRPTEAVARSGAQELERRGSRRDREALGRAVRYGSGVAWGALYGILAGSSPRLRTLPAGITYGLGVWFLSDDVLLPGLRLYAWPPASPMRSHVYAMAAHAAYGAALYGVFDVLGKKRRPMLATIGAAVLTRKLPRILRARARPAARAGLRVGLRVREVVNAVR